ncbi:amidase [Lentibacter algarum]|uniref:amidase n=1 Tax=Lentibacter algarum TaxID=576131 RepID=UPI001C0712DB|nr:amidase [Lentibacter algarum]MBU2982011.1 amidase [Lentibacter algarum]
MKSSPENPDFEATEATLRAFVFIAPERSEPTETDLPLAGCTLAVKDLFDVQGMPTSYGSPIYADRIATQTADAVKRAQAAGATVVGKTVTTEFATFKPGPTTNPQNPAYTPGGSSSGSAAAVGAGLVSHAIGTQTAGSVIRPAAFCGVVGFLPSMGLVSRDGLKVVSPTLDRIGVFARSVTGAHDLAAVIADLPATGRSNTGPNRVGFFADDTWSDADSATRNAMRALRDTVTATGDVIVDLGDGRRIHDLIATQSDLMQCEVARSLAPELRNHADLISDQLTAYCEAGAKLSDAQYAAACQIGEAGRAWIADLFETVDVIASPSARTLPPLMQDGTGDPYVNRAWSLLNVPCITMPTAPHDSGLKGAIQLVGGIGQDLHLISIAELYEERVLLIRP